jgi:hypothetical protein
MRHIALQNKTLATGMLQQPMEFPARVWPLPNPARRVTEALPFARIANCSLTIVLHLQKHSRYSLVPLIPCAESAPGTYSSGTPAPWDERREQPCNLLRTPAIAARSPYPPCRSSFFAKQLVCLETPLIHCSKQAYLWAACLEADSCFVAWTITFDQPALPCIGLRYSTSRAYSASYIRSRLPLLLV